MRERASVFLLTTTGIALACLIGCGGGGTPTVDTPTFTPPSGTYVNPITVTMSDGTPGASIYYTNGTQPPTAASTLYTGPFTVSTTQTLQIVGIAKGYLNSPLVFATYNIEQPAATPTFYPPSGSYAGPLTVKIADTTPNATIYYTIDGSTPTTSSPVYTTPLTVTANETINAVATATGFRPSAIGTATYTITSAHGTSACLSGCGSTPGSGPPLAGGGAYGVLQSMGWTDSSNNLWNFGGQLTVNHNDCIAQLWYFSPSQQAWTEVSGGSTTDTPGIYGTLGTPAAANIPGARFASFTWTDAFGNFWLFGGQGYDLNGTVGLLNDLWKYNPISGQWTWEGGSNTVNAPGIYGTENASAPANVPGARSAGVSWTDHSGNFWLFGENGIDSAGTHGLLNDLWEYSPTTSKWTWISGSKTAGALPTFGLAGVTSPLNTPGGYSGGSVGAVDPTGNLLFVSGTGLSVNQTSALLNTLWQYNPVTAQWTWIDGSDTGASSGKYGILGTPATTNIPGSRQFGVGWTDPNNNLWTLGGSGLDSTGASGLLNDFWEFNPATQLWVWKAGSNTVNASAAYGTQGFSSVNNISGAREYSVSWLGTDGNLYFYGGYGYDNTGTLVYLQDFWRYTP